MFRPVHPSRTASDVSLVSVMDLSRLVVAFCSSAYEDPALRARFFNALFAGAGWDEPWVSPLPKPRETNLLFVFRSVANAFQDGAHLNGGSGGAWTLETLARIGDAPYTILTNNLRTSVATITFKCVFCTLCAVVVWWLV